MLNTLSKRYIVRRVPTRLKFQIASREGCETDAECGYSDQHQPYRLTPKYHQVAPSTASRLIFKQLESGDCDKIRQVRLRGETFEHAAQIVRPVLGRYDKTDIFH